MAMHSFQSFLIPTASRSKSQCYMQKKLFHIVIFIVALFGVACENYSPSPAVVVASENYLRLPSVDITSYASTKNHKRKYTKIILSVFNKNSKILEMNLNDSRFDQIRHNLNDFINDANSAIAIFPKGSFGTEVFGDFGFYGFATFIDRRGKKSKKLCFTPRLLMGYLEMGATQKGGVKFIERTIDMGVFLLPHEVEIINNVFTPEFCYDL